MSTVFIWKASVANNADSYLKYVMGPNWILEDYPDSSTKSYKIVSQTSLIDSVDNADIAVFNIAPYSDNWCGGNILEIINVPYKLLKVDKYGIYEQLGEWNRVTLNKLVDSQFLGKEYNNIKNWILRKARNNIHQSSSSSTASSDFKQIQPVITAIDNNLHKTTLVKSIPLTHHVHAISPHNNRKLGKGINPDKDRNLNKNTKEYSVDKRKYGTKHDGKHVMVARDTRKKANEEYPPCLIQFEFE
jgi:hypothetical protein